MNWKNLFFKVFAAVVITSATCIVTALFAVSGFLAMQVVTLTGGQKTILAEIKFMNKKDSKLKDVLSEEIVQLKSQNKQYTEVIKDLSRQISSQQILIDEIIIPKLEETKTVIPQPTPIEPDNKIEWYDFPVRKKTTKPSYEKIFPKLEPKKVPKQHINDYRDMLEQLTIPRREQQQMQLKVTE